MKIILITLIALTLLSATSDKEKSFYKDNHLKGKIAILDESTYFVNELGEKSKFLMSQAIYKFDTLGYLIEETNVLAKGNKFTRSIYSNDADGKILQMEEYAKHNKLERIGKFVYDKKGNCITQYLFYEDKKTIAVKVVYTYDKNGNNIELTKYLADTLKMVSKSINKYDKKNNKIETISYKTDLKTSIREVYKYDKLGNNIEYNGYNVKGILASKILYTYDSTNNQIEYMSVRGDGITIDQWTKSKFDNNHNLIELNYIRPDGTVEEKNTYELTYDKQGNWIKQKRKTNDGLNGIVDRKITYY